MTNQINKTPVLFVQPFADGVTVKQVVSEYPTAGTRATDKALASINERGVAILRGIIRNPAAAKKEDREALAGYLGTAGSIFERVADAVTDGCEILPDAVTDGCEILPDAVTDVAPEVFETAMSLFNGAGLYLINPQCVEKVVSEGEKPFPAIVEALQSPNEFTQADYVAINAVLDEALETVRVLQDDEGLQELFVDDFTADDYEKAVALIGLIRAAMPLPCEVMAERGEYYADEDGAEA